MAQHTATSNAPVVGDPSTIRSRPMTRRKRRGAIAQVVLFITVWSTLVSIFGLLAVLPTLAELVRQSEMVVVGPNGEVSARLEPEQLNALMTASSTATLGVAAATVLATLLSVWIMQRFFDGPALLDLGLRRRPGWLTDTLVGLALGPLMFLVVLLILVALGWASVEPGTIGLSGLLVAFVTFVLVAISEELFARGWVLQVLEQGRGPKVAVIGSAAIFSLLHAFNPGFGLMALVGLFLAGLLFAQAYLVTRQLWLPIALHLSWNFSEGPLFGFPVSGLPGDGLLTVKPAGPELVTGGAFGPEAGLIVVLGIAVAAAAIVALGRLRPAPAALGHRRPAPTDRAVATRITD
jgi:membrane protease YdiL (CAAX protease family)